MSEWTPGPWGPDPLNEFSLRTDNEPVALVAISGDMLRARANARLIAAAPEMAELLRQARQSTSLLGWYARVDELLVRIEGNDDA